MTTHDRRLSLVVDRHNDQRDTPDRDAKPGAVIKFAACMCTDGQHTYPDRLGWVTTEGLAHEDWLASDPERAHIVMRFTAAVEDARELIIGALARAAGDETTPHLWQETLYGRTADVLIDVLSGGAA